MAVISEEKMMTCWIFYLLVPPIIEQKNTDIELFHKSKVKSLG